MTECTNKEFTPWGVPVKIADHARRFMGATVLEKDLDGVKINHAPYDSKSAQDKITE